jgi:hypothetical protein
MATRPKKKIPTLLRRALGPPLTVGRLEVLAGIDTAAPAARISFWSAFMHMPSTDGLDAGCRELRRLAEARACAVETAI